MKNNSGKWSMDMRVGLSRFKAYDFFLEQDLRVIFSNGIFIPSVFGILTTEGWDSSGAVREICFNNGSLAFEKLTLAIPGFLLGSTFYGFTSGPLALLESINCKVYLSEDDVELTKVRIAFTFIPKGKLSSLLLCMAGQKIINTYFKKGLKRLESMTNDITNHRM